MQNNLNDFMKNTVILNDKYSVYSDEEKGVMFYLNTIQLLTRVDYLELSKEEFVKAKFEMKIDKDLEYNIINVKRPVPKNVITKKDEDKYTIVESEVAVRQVWNVTNALGFKKSFTNKDEALEFAEDINQEVMNRLEK